MKNPEIKIFVFVLEGFEKSEKRKPKVVVVVVEKRR